MGKRKKKELSQKDLKSKKKKEKKKRKEESLVGWNQRKEKSVHWVRDES